MLAMAVASPRIISNTPIRYNLIMKARGMNARRSLQEQSTRVIYILLHAVMALVSLLAHPMAAVQAYRLAAQGAMFL
jgi:hypothetical protein